ncbi:MAG: hypothetical protein DI588_12660 [Flavobacterium johnsoniae]|nr:MAG: hypothetical protein DI588_12660 [Flavobacterium johnsoniae]
MILIYSKDVDDFVNQVIDCLERGFVRFSEYDKININVMEFSNEIDSYVVENDYIESIDLKKIKSVWFNGGVVASTGDEYENKCYEVLNDAYLLNNSIYKLGKRIADFEFNRLDVMLEAKKQGLKIPHTLITGSKTILEKFMHSKQNGVISKRILDSHFYEDDKFSYNFNLTFSITPKILSEVPAEFALSFFQERIIADFEIRVIYIDGNIFSACIYNFEDIIDYRTTLWDMENLRIVPFKLPVEIMNKIDRVFKNFNINYGSVDLMYSNGEYYFLEINPAGQISFINNACNFYIQNYLAEKLKNGK